MSAMIITATAAVMESTEELSVVALFSVVITDPVTVIVYRRRLSSHIKGFHCVSQLIKGPILVISQNEEGYRDGKNKKLRIYLIHIFLPPMPPLSTVVNQVP